MNISLTDSQAAEVIRALADAHADKAESAEFYQQVIDAERHLHEGARLDLADEMEQHTETTQRFRRYMEWAETEAATLEDEIGDYITRIAELEESLEASEEDNRLLSEDLTDLMNEQAMFELAVHQEFGGIPAPENVPAYALDDPQSTLAEMVASQ